MDLAIKEHFKNSDLIAKYVTANHALHDLHQVMRLALVLLVDLAEGDAEIENITQEMDRALHRVGLQMGGWGLTEDYKFVSKILNLSESKVARE